MDSLKQQIANYMTRIEYFRRQKKRRVLKVKILRQRVFKLVGPPDQKSTVLPEEAAN